MEAFANKIDPAQLRLSYTEFLLPRLEIGLLHADVTEKMCNAWMSSIIFTLCKRGRFSNAHSLNRMAFCLLADIPDIWLHTNMIRATELLCYLNSKNSDAGLSTGVMFCDVVEANSLEKITIVSAHHSDTSRSLESRLSHLPLNLPLTQRGSSTTFVRPYLFNARLLCIRMVQPPRGTILLTLEAAFSSQMKNTNPSGRVALPSARMGTTL
jgi:hypothetical protein